MKKEILLLILIFLILSVVFLIFIDVGKRNMTNPQLMQETKSYSFSSVFSGSSHFLAIKDDSTLWAWGYNEYGQLGLGDEENKDIPSQVSEEGDWELAAGGDFHTLAIKKDGTLWAWGLNEQGQLGLGDDKNRNIPTQIGEDSDWGKIFAGKFTSFALKEDGTLFAWGYNEYEQLGLGDKENRDIPTQVGKQSDWKEVSAGDLHTLALKEDGTLWAWGAHGYGQLGLGLLSDTSNLNTPSQVGEDVWKSIAAGGIHSLGIKEDGTLWAWGDDRFGQLGLDSDPETNSYLNPQKVGLFTDWKALESKGIQSFGIREDNTLWAWGNNKQGQLGTGDTENRTTMERVGEDNNWKMVTTGNYFTLGLKTDGTLWLWGGIEETK